ncbi:MAG: ABC transporter permease subunit [Candidatus Limnocylindrales bacterium]|nr:ABC transporter permease subunit [Candidatus Limnocylindrales bacterium]
MNATAVNAARSHPPRFPARRHLTNAAPPAIALLAGILAWEVVARAWGVVFFPPFSAVVVRLAELTAGGRILSSLVGTLTNLVIGFTIAAVFGVGIGMLMGAYRKVEMALDIYVYAMLTAPSLVFAPIFFAIFGLSRASILGVVIIYSIFIIIVNTVAAIRSVPIALVEMGRSYCASERQLFMKIILPAALPLIFAGLRLGIGRAVKGTINGEMFITAVGLGAVVISAGRRFDAAAVLAVLLVIIIIALVAVKIVQIVDARMTGWLPSTARQQRTRRGGGA